MRASSLLENPFALLRLGPDASRPAVVQRAQEIASPEADAASRALVAPRTRLQAELAFLPGTNTDTAEKIVADLRAGIDPDIWSLSLPARANIYAHLVALGSKDASGLREFVQIQARLEDADVAEIVANDRSAAGMPKPPPDALERGLESLIEIHAESLVAGAAKLGEQAGASLLAELVAGTAPNDTRRAEFLRRSAAAWARETASRTAALDEDASRLQDGVSSAPSPERGKALEL